MSKAIPFIALVSATSLLTACASYQPHNGIHPHGYYEKHDDTGRLKIVYETWRPASEEKVCSMATRRAKELGFTESDIADMQWEQETLFSDNVSQGITIRSAGTTSWSNHQGTATLESGGFVDERTTRRCTLTMGSSAPNSQSED